MFLSVCNKLDFSISSDIKLIFVSEQIYVSNPSDCEPESFENLGK